MNYCQKGRELLLDLKRSDFLPTYDEDGVRTVITEINDLSGKIYSILNENEGDEFSSPVRVCLSYYNECLKRNRRYLNSYVNHRLMKIRGLRWETGAVLPESIRHDTLSARENDFFGDYNGILTEYGFNVGLDLTSDLEPPKELFIQVRVLEPCGEIMTDNGPVTLDERGSTQYLRRADVEHLIRQGHLEHVMDDEV